MLEKDTVRCSSLLNRPNRVTIFNSSFRYRGVLRIGVDDRERGGFQRGEPRREPLGDVAGEWERLTFNCLRT